jgi:hypothetical protein
LLKVEKEDGAETQWPGKPSARSVATQSFELRWLTGSESENGNNVLGGLGDAHCDNLRKYNAKSATHDQTDSIFCK